MQPALERIRPQTIEAHLRFLSHPLLEGRAPGTRGGDLAVEYVRAQFQRIGLEPVAGSYLQEVPMIGLDPAPQLAFATSGGEAISPEYRSDYVLAAGVPEARVEVEAELVYVGYGISAPEWEWDDYAESEVAGKVLLMRVNDPGNPDTPDFFDGRALTYYGRWTYKFEEAARRGAAGAILIHTDESAGYGWNVVRTSNTGEQFTLAGDDAPALPIKGWVRSEVAGALLRAAGHDPAELERTSERRAFRPVPTGSTVRASVRSEVREVRTANVVGLLAGRTSRR
ncbi:MAG: PA domain-containing protein, partial [Longimicrobiaceae bacterium]